ncbi:MAG: hypothetical protein R3C02_24005 [Planctomycetaceae bacterium]
MRSRGSLLSGILLVAITAFITTLARDSAAQGDPNSISLEQLQERLAVLEARVTALEAGQSGVQQAAGVAPLLETVPRSLADELPRIPRNAKRGEINGVPFYTVPLGGSAEAE